jgi:hypothetical protein
MALIGRRLTTYAHGWRLYVKGRDCVSDTSPCIPVEKRGGTVCAYVNASMRRASTLLWKKAARNQGHTALNCGGKIVGR